MNLEQLKQKGAFVSLAPVAKEIVWKHKDPETGEEVEDTLSIYVQPLCAGAYDVLRVGMKKAREDGGSDNAAMVSFFICDEHGKPVFTYEEAYSMDESLFNVLLATALKVNRLGGEAKN